MLIHFWLAVAAVASGAIASVAGFGIGSILTPILALGVGTKLAVAAVSVPHFCATLLRWWLLRAHVDRTTLIRFGLVSAAGGLAGGLLHAMTSSRALTTVFAVLLVFAGFAGLTGYSRRMRFGRGTAWAAGAFSGLLGGLVGNQGGIRSAALLGFNLERQGFVATSTAIGVIVDLARVPVYLITETGGLLQLWKTIALTTAGVLAGTVLGARLLRGIPEDRFLRVVGVLILALGLWMFYRALSR